MKKAIVITTINEPTEAIIKFASLQEYTLIVVGDRKTPVKWNYENTIYIEVEDSRLSRFELNQMLPFNHYCRKMLGYLYAIENGFEVIIDTDDDNIPKQDWGFPRFEGQFDFYSSDPGFVNIYQYYTPKKIWPRGLPLNKINHQFNFDTISLKSANVGVWQGLADEDPDVDAIYRLTSDEPCVFNSKPPVVLDLGVISPFNTQNTCIRKELFALMYLPTYVTFRYTDILRGFVAQPIMWLYGYHLGFTNATVVQKRNPHDYFKDFISEIPMFTSCSDIVSMITGVLKQELSIGENLMLAYIELQKNGIVTEQELLTLRAWLNDLKTLKQMV